MDALQLIENDEALFHAERIGLNTALGVMGLGPLPEDFKYLPYLAKLADIQRLERCGSEQGFASYTLGLAAAFTVDLEPM